MTPPIQTLLTIIALLDKPDGGKRPIGLLQFIYRLWSATRRNLVTTWVDQRAGFWDDAIKGSSALRAALRRLLSDELAGRYGQNSATIF